MGAPIPILDLLDYSSKTPQRIDYVAVMMHPGFPPAPQAAESMGAQLAAGYQFVARSRPEGYGRLYRANLAE
jgi:hypothetical protein